MSIAFFDFDGTITKSDSLKHFLFFYFSRIELIWKSFLFSPFIIAYYGGLINNSQAKEKLFKICFKGASEVDFNNKCLAFATHVLPKLIKSEAISRIQWHHNQNHKVVVVSASIQNYLELYFEKLSIEVISTEIEIIDHVLTGNFSTKNCYGEEKRKRVLSSYDLKLYDTVYAYGDSKGDRELLELATKSFYRTFE